MAGAGAGPYNGQLSHGSARWRRVEELYHAARSLPEQARAQFLAQQCRGDESLHSDVQSLLGQSDQTWPPPYAGAPRTIDGAAPMIGCRIGGYQVTALIGAGGMGEVYRARDAKLGRNVAIKILPLEWSADPDRLARLDREARVAPGCRVPWCWVPGASSAAHERQRRGLAGALAKAEVCRGVKGAEPLGKK